MECVDDPDTPYSIRIPSVEPEDGGNYTCRYEFTRGSVDTAHTYSWTTKLLVKGTALLVSGTVLLVSGTILLASGTCC